MGNVSHSVATPSPRPPEWFMFGNKSAHGSGTGYEAGWRYEAPTSLDRRKEMYLPFGEEPRGVVWPRAASDGTPLDQEQQRMDRDERVESFLEVPDEIAIETRTAAEDDLPANASKSTKQNEATLASILQTLDSQGTPAQQDLDPLVDYVESTKHSPDDGLTLRIIQWLATTERVSRIPTTVWQALSHAIASKIRLASLSEDELMTIIVEMLQRTEAYDESLTVLVQSTKDCAPSVLAKVTEHIIASALEEERSARTESWLEHLRAANVTATSEAGKAVFACLAKHFQPSELALHLVTLPQSILAEVLVQHWARRYVKISVADYSTKEVETVLRKSFSGYFERTEYRHPPNVDVNWEHIRRQFMAMNTIRRHHSDDELRARNSLLNLIAHLAHHNLPYLDLLDEIFAIYIKMYPANTTRNLFLKLQDPAYAIGIPTTLAARLVNHFVTTNNTVYAYQIFNTVPTLSLTQCPDLLPALISENHLQIEHLFALLNRRTPSDTVPHEWRSDFQLAIKQPMVDIVHRAAYAWARSPHISARTAFRRVWECYRFLIDRRAPLTKLMARAMVRAGITRALREGGRTSAAQVKYIIHVVDRIEGSEVAKEVDRLVYGFWERFRKFAGPPKRVDGEPDGIEFKRKLWRKEGGKVWDPSWGRTEGVDVETHELDGAEDDLSSSSAAEFEELAAGQELVDFTVEQDLAADQQLFRSTAESYVAPEATYEDAVQVSAEGKEAQEGAYTPFSPAIDEQAVRTAITTAGDAYTSGPATSSSTPMSEEISTVEELANAVKGVSNKRMDRDRLQAWELAFEDQMSREVELEREPLSSLPWADTHDRDEAAGITELYTPVPVQSADSIATSSPARSNLVHRSLFATDIKETRPSFLRYLDEPRFANWRPSAFPDKKDATPQFEIVEDDEPDSRSAFVGLEYKRKQLLHKHLRRPWDLLSGIADQSDDTEVVRQYLAEGFDDAFGLAGLRSLPYSFFEPDFAHTESESRKLAEELQTLSQTNAKPKTKKAARKKARTDASTACEPGLEPEEDILSFRVTKQSVVVPDDPSDAHDALEGSGTVVDRYVQRPSRNMVRRAAEALVRSLSQGQLFALKSVDNIHGTLDDPDELRRALEGTGTIVRTHVPIDAQTRSPVRKLRADDLSVGSVDELQELEASVENGTRTLETEDVIRIEERWPRKQRKMAPRRLEDLKASDATRETRRAKVKGVRAQRQVKEVRVSKTPSIADFIRGVG